MRTRILASALLLLAPISGATDAQSEGGAAVAHPGPASPPSAEHPSARLSKGTYKFAGRCSKMSELGKDLTVDCGVYLAIIAKDPERPLFIVPMYDRKGAWEYQVDAPGVPSIDGMVMTYAISSVTVLAARQEDSRISYDWGECVNSVRRGEPLLRCTSWHDEKRTKITREVVFEGSGNWVFDRNTP